MNVNELGKREFFKTSEQALEASRLRPSVMMYAIDTKEVYMGGKVLGNENISIPTKVSDLNNDLNFMTPSEASNYGFIKEEDLGPALILKAIGSVMDIFQGDIAISDDTIYVDLGNYYRFDSPITELTVVLPDPSSFEEEEDFVRNRVRGCVLSFTTDSSPNISINGNGGTISYFEDYSIDADTSYEINIIWNGAKWIVAYGIIS